MSSVLKAESTLTDSYQTTVPETVRRALRLGKKDKIQYTITANGEVILSRAEKADGDDPVLGQFLRFLAHDIANSPERLQAVDTQLVQRLRGLVKGVELDLDSPLSTFSHKTLQGMNTVMAARLAMSTSIGSEQSSSSNTGYSSGTTLSAR